MIAKIANFFNKCKFGRELNECISNALGAFDFIRDGGEVMANN